MKERQKLKELALKRLSLTYNEGDSTEVRYGNGKAEIIDFGILDKQGERTNILETGKRHKSY